MKSYFECVKEFHEAFGSEVRNEPFDELETIPDESWVLRQQLHVEEWEELNHELVLAHDLTTVGKEIADLIYVLCGTCVSWGIPLDEVFAEVHRSNMSKLGKDGKPVYREDGKVLKGENYSPANIYPIIYER